MTDHHKEKRFERILNPSRIKHISPRIERAYADWIRRFTFLDDQRRPKDVSRDEIGECLTLLC